MNLAYLDCKDFVIRPDLQTSIGLQSEQFAFDWLLIFFDKLDLFSAKSQCHFPCFEKFIRSKF